MERFQRSGSAALTLDGSIWYIAPYTRNLFRYDPETHETRRLTEADGLAGDAVFAVYKDRMGTVWVSTTGGITRYDGRTFRSFSMREIAGVPEKFLEAPACFAGQVECMAMDRQGILWIGTPMGVYRFDGTKFTHLTYADGIYNLSGVPIRGIEAILEDSDGKMWFGGSSTEGVFCYDGSALRHHRPASGLGLLPLFEDLQGDLWFRSQSASLFSISRPRRDVMAFERFTLPGISDVISDMAQDAAGNFLFGSVLFSGREASPMCPEFSGTTVLQANGINLLVLTPVPADSTLPAATPTIGPGCSEPIPVYVPWPFTAPDFPGFCR